MVHVSIGILSQTRRRKVHERFERSFFLRSGVSPERFEVRLAAFEVVHAEQVLKPTHFVRVAFHIEEQVSFVGSRQTREPSALFARVEQLDFPLTIDSRAELKARLIADTSQRCRIQSSNRNRLVQLTERLERRDASRLQPPRLDLRNVRHLTQVIVVDATLFADLTPLAQIAVLARIWIGLCRFGTQTRFKPPAQLSDIARIVLIAIAELRQVAQY